MPPRKASSPRAPVFAGLSTGPCGGQRARSSPGGANTCIAGDPAASRVLDLCLVSLSDPQQGLRHTHPRGQGGGSRGGPPLAFRWCLVSTPSSGSPLVSPSCHTGPALVQGTLSDTPPHPGAWSSKAQGGTHLFPPSVQSSRPRRPQLGARAGHAGRCRAEGPRPGGEVTLVFCAPNTL